MMKRILAAAAALLLLCGCTGSESKAVYSTAQADEVLSSGAFEGSQMAPVDSYVAAMLYGIDESTITECAVYMATNTSVSADELAILIFADEESAIAAEAACKARVAAQIAVCESYAPAAVPRLEQAIVNRRGYTVLLAVGDPDILSSLKGIQ